MQVLPIDVVALAGIIVGGLFVITPMLGFTARFALKPLVEAAARMREGQHSSQDLALLERRVALLEQHLNSIDTNLDRLIEQREFDRQLEGGSRT